MELARTPDDLTSEQLAIARDIGALGTLDVLPELLKMVCDTTQMGFAAVARVTDDRWTAMAVEDRIAFGLQPGGELDVHSTLCKEVRAARTPIVIDEASRHPVYCDHHTPRTYRIESYISVPIVLADGSYFGNLCAIDPRPAQVDRPAVRSLFALLSRLIALHLQSEQRRRAAETAVLDERAAGELREQFIAMITDVLDLARGRLGGGFHIEPAPVADLDVAFAEVVQELRDTHAGRRVDAHVAIGRTVWCDRPRLQQLVSNLLANAMTHGGTDDPVRLDVAVDGADTLVVTVHNLGHPIPDAHLAHLFEPFWRASASPRREGLGLGLFICHHIAHAHRGTIDVRSTAAAGTTFTVRLPVNAPDAPA